MKCPARPTAPSLTGCRHLLPPFLPPPHPTCQLLPTADERLHTAFHAAATQGPRYQGWQGERVAAVDGAKGRVLLFAGVGAGGRGPKVGGVGGWVGWWVSQAEGGSMHEPLPA